MELVKPEAGNLSLLFVEDDPVARELINVALSIKFPKLRMLTAENGKVGLDLYEQHRPDIVLTDIKMPVMDGIAMASAIRGLHPEAVIAVMSAYCDTPQYLESAHAIGISHCVVKPVDYHTLFATIEECIGEVPPNSREN